MNEDKEIKKLKFEDNDEDEDEFTRTDKVILVVNLLNKYKIKLWEIDNLEQIDASIKIDSINSSFDDLIMKISDESGLIEKELKEILIKLQKHSIKKLESNKRYNKDGIAVLSLKIIGNNNNIQPKTFKQNIEIPINITGKELKNLIHEKFQFNCDNLKLIYNGKIIKDEVSLTSQELKNHSTFMVMCIYEKISIQNENKNSEDYKMISDIKDAIELLSDSKFKNHGFNDLQLRNQNGVVIEMSNQDQKCLTMAMILHQKGKSFIKNKEYLKALILLAEAENEFKNCNDRALLERIDNYALLNLDIVWCYLCLQNLHDLKNAEDRLTMCEKCLEKCYGSNLERLTLLQGNANKYTPIFIRLNLLKAILNYHKGKKRECKQYLDIANLELQRNTVDEEKIVQVMQMGFTSTQARLALRSTSGNVNAAIEQIFKQNELKKKAEKIDKETKYSKKLDEKYGRTIKDSKPIDVHVLKDLIQFGYTEDKAAKALIQSNNDFNLALDILQSQIDDDDDEPTTSTLRSDKTDIPEELIVQLCSMGYDADIAKSCLKAFNSNIQKSIDYLLNHQNKDEILKECEKLIKTTLSKSTTKTTTTTHSNAIASVEELLKANEAKKLITEDAPEDDEEYLDINLDDDALFINKYYSLLL